tara:strand:+ start:282 stop:452 length:171 start_codon:yes stop_codon:yes gene_type:complete
MRFFGLISILITVAIALWWFTQMSGIGTPVGETGEAQQSYNDMIESAKSAADSISR